MHSIETNKEENKRRQGINGEYETEGQNKLKTVYIIHCFIVTDTLCTIKGYMYYIYEHF